MIKKNAIKANKIKLSLALSLALAILLGAQWASAQTLISWCSDEHFDSRITVSEAYQDNDGVDQAMDIDKDDDGLIEICDLEGLNAMRYVLDGSGYRDSATATKITTGCASGGCTGYELVRHLDFFDDASYRTTANRILYSEGLGWEPIGFDGNNLFIAHFNGNRYTVANLWINRPMVNNIALFGTIGNATIENLGLLNVNIVGNRIVSGLVGNIQRSGATITNSYVVGGRIAAVTNSTGGLIGRGASFFRAVGNYTRVVVTGQRTVGTFIGGDSIGRRENNYAAGTVSGTREVGGFIGTIEGTTIFNHNYATAAVTGTSHGGFVGGVDDIAAPTFKSNYWDTERSGQSSSVGQGAGEIEGYSTAAMQSPTAPGATSTEIYYEWSEEHWDFGTSTQYPALRYLSGNEALGHQAGDLLPYQRPGLRDLQLTSADNPLAIGFRTDNLEYYHKVSYDVTEVVVTATTETGATLRINGAPALSGEPQTVALVIATTTTIAIEVLGLGEITPTSYTIAIFRATAPLLAELALSHGTLQPPFNTSTSDYTLQVANSIANITVTTVTALDPNATIEIYRNELDEASRIVPHNAAIALAEGTTTTIHIRVTVSDRGEISEQIYRIAVKRALSSDATLAALGFGHDPALIDFAAATYQYSVSIDGLRTVDLVLRTADEHARVVVQRDASVVAADVSGNYPIALTRGGTTTIKITVTAQDGNAMQDYTITVRQQPGSQAELIELRISDHVGKRLPLTMRAETEYTAMVFAGSQVRLSLETSPGARVMVTVGNRTLIPKDDDAGMTYYPISLALDAAATTITLIVAAEDASTTTDYSLVIHPIPNTTAFLEALSLSDGSLSPSFSTATLHYTSTGPHAATLSLTPQASLGSTLQIVRTVAADPQTILADTHGAYRIALSRTTTTVIAITVTAQDGQNTRTYTLTVPPSAIRPTSGIRIRSRLFLEASLP